MGALREYRVTYERSDAKHVTLSVWVATAAAEAVAGEPEFSKVTRVVRVGS